ncbi:MAG: glycosyltransferase family 4 protein [Ilumatobacteraceae bacterium]
MRVLMLSWEYPPHLVGGIATHVEGLAAALARAGHDVVVCTPAAPGSDDADESVGGVRVLRADVGLPWLPDDEFVARAIAVNHHLVRITSMLGSWTPDVVHAHDWLTAWAADTLRALHHVPMVATVHATERGRHGGHLPEGLPGTVNSAEWWLTYQARSVIACSRYMVREVIDGFDLPPDKVHLVPNGIDVARWTTGRARPPAHGPLVVAWGRVQYEKGFQVLVRAIAELRHRVPGLRCVIAGRGTYLPELQGQIDVDGVGDIVHLAGFMPDADLRTLLADAACVVIPSLYEPFGIVALEGMAAGAPVVVARTGGLAEILAGTGAGQLFEPGDPHDLAAAIERVVADPAAAEQMRTEAAALLRRTYSWDAVAAATLQVYEAAAR